MTTITRVAAKPDATKSCEGGGGGIYVRWTHVQLIVQRKWATCQKHFPKNKHVTKEKRKYTLKGGGMATLWGHGGHRGLTIMDRGIHAYDGTARAPAYGCIKLDSFGILIHMHGGNMPAHQGSKLV